MDTNADAEKVYSITKFRTDDIRADEDVTFQELSLSSHVLEGLKKAGFEKPSPIQLKAIPYGCLGVDLVVQAKSGTGKTCVFTVIALESVVSKVNRIQVLIVTPTREIAQQIQSVIMSLGCNVPGLKCCCFIGGTAVKEDRKKAAQCHIAVGTTGRLQQLIKDGVLKTGSIRAFILDEADKLLEPSSQEIINWIYSQLPENKQVVAVSATYTEALAQHATVYMRNPTFVRLNSADPSLLGIKQLKKVVARQRTAKETYHRKAEEVISILSSISFQQCLVFSNFQTSAENLSDLLCSKGWPSTYTSGSQEQEHRTEAMKQLKEYKCRILISTDLSSRGIDADHVNLVINLDVPYSGETYLHRIGRAGRFGTRGAAITLLSSGAEETEFYSMEKKLSLNVDILPDPLMANFIGMGVLTDGDSGMDPPTDTIETYVLQNREDTKAVAHSAPSAEPSDKGIVPSDVPMGLLNRIAKMTIPDSLHPPPHALKPRPSYSDLQEKWRTFQAVKPVQDENQLVAGTSLESKEEFLGVSEDTQKAVRSFLKELHSQIDSYPMFTAHALGPLVPTAIPAHPLVPEAIPAHIPEGSKHKTKKRKARAKKTELPVAKQEPSPEPEMWSDDGSGGFHPDNHYVALARPSTARPSTARPSTPRQSSDTRPAKTGTRQVCEPQDDEDGDFHPDDHYVLPARSTGSALTSDSQVITDGLTTTVPQSKVIDPATVPQSQVIDPATVPQSQVLDPAYCSDEVADFHPDDHYVPSVRPPLSRGAPSKDDVLGNTDIESRSSAAREFERRSDAAADFHPDNHYTALARPATCHREATAVDSKATVNVAKSPGETVARGKKIHTPANTMSNNPSRSSICDVNTTTANASSTAVGASNEVSVSVPAVAQAAGTVWDPVHVVQGHLTNTPLNGAASVSAAEAELHVDYERKDDTETCDHGYTYTEVDPRAALEQHLFSVPYTVNTQRGDEQEWDDYRRRFIDQQRYISYMSQFVPQ